MEIIKFQEGNKVKLAVKGLIDTETASILDNALLSLDYDGLDLTLDFKDTKYITSTGLRVLLVARKKLTENTMRIVNANESVLEVFDATGFADMIPITGGASGTGETGELDYKHCFSAMLKQRVEQDGDRVAYVFLGKEYTWKQVDKISGVIAKDLVSMGVKKGSHVGICSPNSINWIFTFFAVQKLGAIAVLVNYGLRPGEVVTMSKIANITHLCYGEIPGMTTFDMYASTVVGGESKIEKIYNIGIGVDFTARMAEPVPEGIICEQANADDASVIIFTSGSTGLPKAVLSSSYNQMLCVAPMAEHFKMTKEDVNLSFLPFFHIFGIETTISLGVTAGFKCIIPHDNKPNTLINLIDQYKCTCFHSVPTMMLAITQASEFTPEKLSSLRVSVLGGAATTEAQMNMLRKLLPNNHFGNIYGMSENALVSITGYEDTVEHITQTIGKPSPLVQFQIRELGTGKVLPAGQSGEIFIRSKSMVVCYYNLEASKQPVDEGGWLATGDLGVLCDDGYIKLVGRAKELIIRGGENISPNEVAGAVATLPQVADVKVLGVPHEILGEEVAAVIKLKEGASFNAEEAKAALLQKIAKFKVPAHFVIVDQFPLLGSGKIDAITLKKMVMEQLKK